MPAYVVVDVDVTDPTLYAKYLEVVPETIRRYGGRYVVRGGAAETLEGERTPGRVVVLQFESMERAKAWWSSSEYAEPRAIRQRASTAHMFVVDGVAPGGEHG